MSAVICNLPVCFCASFIAAKIGRSGQPVQNPGGRMGTVFDRSGTLGRSWFGARTSDGSRSGADFRRKSVIPSSITCPVYSPAIGKMPLPCSFTWEPAR